MTGKKPQVSDKITVGRRNGSNHSGQERIAVGISVVVAVTFGGWLLADTAGAAKTAGQGGAPTVAISGSDRFP